jgi:predicted GNAT superfamily acetyltransferase
MPETPPAVEQAIEVAGRRITLRGLRSPHDYAQGIALQHDTWGQAFTECVPVTILQISQKVGGIAAGAFDENETMIGFVFGLTGVQRGQLVHWSHMLAVDPGAQGLGIGRRLKWYQRDALLALHVESCYWTYDPLQARNAHLNINKLGALPIDYVRDMYGEDTKSELHSGLGTDRYVVEWKLQSDLVQQAYAGTTRQREKRGPDSECVEIPESIDDVRRHSLERAQQWRADTRRALLDLLSRSYTIDGFIRDPDSGRCFYVLNPTR